ncbi:MAG: hypothetical protein ABFD64_12445 [Armatimonadota bacterium]
MRSNRGVGLIDVMITVMLLGMAGVIFTATFPTGHSALNQAEDTKKAVELAQKKLEQVKALGYESLSYTNLRAANAIDEDQTSSPYNFTSVDNLAKSLASSSGTLEITNYAAGIKKVVATVSWNSSGVARSVKVQTLIADKRPWGA